MKEHKKKRRKDESVSHRPGDWVWVGNLAAEDLSSSWGNLSRKVDGRLRTQIVAKVRIAIF